MKRILIALLLILSMVVCLPSCKDEKIEENPEFAKFNEMFESNFENYTITVDTTSKSGNELNDKYVITTVDGKKTVNYRIETLNTFEVEGDVITVPDGYKKVSKGTCDASEFNSTSSVFPSTTATDSFLNFDIPKFNFSYKHIDNDMIIPGRFIGSIKSLNGFMGLYIESSEAKFSLEYEQSSPKSMQITYAPQNGNTVVITYTFN